MASRWSSLLMVAFCCIVVFKGLDAVDIAVNSSNVTANKTEVNGTSFDLPDVVINYNAAGNETDFKLEDVVMGPAVVDEGTYHGGMPAGPGSSGSAGCTVSIQSYSSYDGPCVNPSIGYVDLNRRRVWSAGWCDSGYPNLRGVNTILIDPVSCGVIQVRNFDTGADMDWAADLVAYLMWLHDGSVVVVVTGDEPTQYLSPALRTLSAAGAFVADVQSRGNFAAILQRGYPGKTRLIKSTTNANLNILLEVFIRGSSEPDLQFVRPPHVPVGLVGPDGPV